MCETSKEVSGLEAKVQKIFDDTFEDDYGERYEIYKDTLRKRVLAVVADAQQQRDYWIDQSEFQEDKKTEAEGKIIDLETKIEELEGKLARIRQKLEPCDHQIEHPTWFRIVVSKEEAKELGLLEEKEGCCDECKGTKKREEGG